MKKPFHHKLKQVWGYMAKLNKPSWIKSIEEIAQNIDSIRSRLSGYQEGFREFGLEKSYEDMSELRTRCGRAIISLRDLQIKIEAALLKKVKK